MAWPDLTQLPANPDDLSPETLREWYTNVRDRFLDLIAELGTDPGGATTVMARLTALEAADATAVFSTKTGSYTLALVDINTIVEMNSASTTTLTVPPNSSVAFPIGSIIGVDRIGTGAVNFVAGSGVAINSPQGMLGLRVRYSSAVLRKRATNEWMLSGDLV
jgi:hypothetical protein